MHIKERALNYVVTVVGTGYVGTACAIGFADLGWSVIGYDILEERIADLCNGLPPYNEAGMVEALQRNLTRGSLRFTTDTNLALQTADCIIIAVGTPALSDGHADLSALWHVVDILANLPPRPHRLVVLRSTVPPGTSDRIATRLAGIADVCFVPEFLREAHALHDLLHPDRHVVGADSEAAATRYLRLVADIAAPQVVTTRLNAELTKLASNAFLAMKISFANEVANLTDVLGGDAIAVLSAMGLDRRIGEAFLQPGIGFGGPCFAKDLSSYERTASSAKTPSELVSATLRVNAHQPRRIVDLLEEALGRLEDTRIAVWGLTYKAGTDDIRSSLALPILRDLSERGARALVFDPEAPLTMLPDGMSRVAEIDQTLSADALLILTEWPTFVTIAPQELARRLQRRIIVDGRNLLDMDACLAAGLRYIGVGRRGEPHTVTSLHEEVSLSLSSLTFADGARR